MPQDIASAGISQDGKEAFANGGVRMAQALRLPRYCLFPRLLGALRGHTRQRLPGCVTVPRRLGLPGPMTVRLTWNLPKMLPTRDASDKLLEAIRKRR
jgi:hypothetical protein